ncbi:MAG: hypothetical protein JWO91_3175 [Acidobacteriaceae bacterium]|nr:hypothetical protein [Acidobacteriaceae bacterium]
MIRPAWYVRKMTNTIHNPIRRFARITATTCLALCLASLPRVSADTSLPTVELNAEKMGPRQIEDLTSKSIPRDYAFAWLSMAQALDTNRKDLLGGYFTGLAKENLVQKIADQQKTGIHLKYEDHGHKLEGLFYSPAGDAMQLRDQAALEIQILDGDKVIQTEQVTLHFIVLMTPGADRWLVRDLETIPEGKP